MVVGIVKFKFTKGPLEWIVLYLAVLIIVDNGLFLVIMFPSLSQWFGFCRALGIALEIVNWVQQGCTLIIAFHQLLLLHKLVQKVRNPYSVLMNDREKVERQGSIMKKCHYVALLLIWLPVLLNVVWLPFAAKDEFQEQEPEWCWIVSITDDCEKDGLQFAEELIMWFIPSAVVGVTIACTTMATLMVWIYTSCKKHLHNAEIVNENYRPNNLITIVTYTLFTLLCAVELAVRVHTMIHHKHNYTMWMIFAVATPLRDILLPICYSVQVYLYRRHHRNILVPVEAAINTSGNIAHFQPHED